MAQRLAPYQLSEMRSKLVASSPRRTRRGQLAWLRRESNCSPATATPCGLSLVQIACALQSASRHHSTIGLSAERTTVGWVERTREPHRETPNGLVDGEWCGSVSTPRHTLRPSSTPLAQYVQCL